MALGAIFFFVPIFPNPRKPKYKWNFNNSLPQKEVKIRTFTTK
jgi:hypothetical protein